MLRPWIAIPLLCVAGVGRVDAEVVVATLDPTSFLAVDVGFVGTDPIVTLGPQTLSGSLTLELSLDGSGNGQFQLVDMSTSLFLEDIPATELDLNFLGKGTISLTGLGLRLASNAVTPVSANTFDLIDTELVIAIDEGVATATATDGLALTLLPDPEEIDFSMDPVNEVFVPGVSVPGTIDEFGFATGLDLTFEIDVGSGIVLEFRAFGDVIASIPEPSSTLLIAGAAPFAILAARLRRKSSSSA